MNEVAVSPTRALPLVVLATPRLAEVGHRRELAHDGSSCVEAPVQLGECILRVLLAVELSIQVACEVITEIASYVHLLEFAEGPQLSEHVFIEFVELLLGLLVIDLNTLLKLYCFLLRIRVHVVNK